MELLCMYISSQGPLRERCFSFDPRCELERSSSDSKFIIKFSDNDELGSEFWSTPYPKNKTQGRVETVNLIIGENGSGKTSLVFLLSSMITQIASGKGGEDGAFSGFSVWLEENRDARTQHFFAFYTEEEPVISFTQKKRKIIAYDFRDAKKVLSNGLAARLIMISSSLENRFFGQDESDPLRDSENTLISSYAFTPQKWIRKGFQIERYLPITSEFRERTLTEESVDIQKKLSTKHKPVEAYFAVQLTHVLDACFKGLAKQLELTGGGNTSNEILMLDGLDLMGSIKLSLVSSSMDREEVYRHLKGSTYSDSYQFHTASRLLRRALSDFEKISKKEWQMMSFRQYQLVRICLQLMVYIKQCLDSPDFLVGFLENETLLGLMRDLERVFHILNSIEEAELNSIEEAEQEIEIQIEHVIEILKHRHVDYATMAEKHLRMTMEQVLAYFSIQHVFQVSENKDNQSEWVFLRRVTSLIEEESAQNGANSKTKQALEQYLAYYLCPIDQGLIWTMPELRLEASRGQINMLMLAADLICILNKTDARTRNCPNILLIDEADLAYHPEWQRIFLYWLLRLLHRLDLTVWHVMIATHSPILISDFPRSNIIRLRNETTENQKKYWNTFAQNIYAIYQNEMHLTTAVGEFARRYLEQILETIKELEQGKCDVNKTYNKAAKMIKKIGDPMLRQAYQVRLDKTRADCMAKGILDRMVEKEFKEEEINLIKDVLEPRE